LFFLLVRPAPRSTLFPYTTLFRSKGGPAGNVRGSANTDPAAVRPSRTLQPFQGRNFSLSYPSNWQVFGDQNSDSVTIAPREALRSEEHTSELQSRRDLVCRLLLEK